MSTISDGLVLSPTAGFELDTEKLTAHEQFYIERAILKGALRVVTYEVVSESN